MAGSENGCRDVGDGNMTKYEETNERPDTNAASKMMLKEGNVSDKHGRTCRTTVLTFFHSLNCRENS